MLSHVRLFVASWNVACQAPLPMEFFRQEYWSGLSCPSPGDLLYPGIEPWSFKSRTLARGFFTIRATWEAFFLLGNDNKIRFYLAGQPRSQSWSSPRAPISSLCLWRRLAARRVV